MMAWEAPLTDDELVSHEAVCAACGEVFDAPGWEDPADTLCVSCAEEEQER